MKFGYISVEDYAKIMPEFTENLKNGKLIGKKCPKCGSEFFPPRGQCSVCDNTDLETFTVSPKATLVSFTIIHFAPDSHNSLAPYIVAIGEHENGYKTMAHLVGVTSLDELKPGLPIELVPQELDGERIIYKYRKRSA